MNKTELIDAVALSADLDKAKASRAVEAVLESISKELQAGGSVVLVNFGTFLVRERAARKGRNPHSGEEMDIPASKAPAFKPGKALKDRLN